MVSGKEFKKKSESQGTRSQKSEIRSQTHQRFIPYSQALAPETEADNGSNNIYWQTV